MIRWRKNLLATILLAAMGLGCGPQTQRFYVSPAGNDSWSGSMSRQADDKSDGPFATIARARDAVRQLRKAGSTYPIEVVVADGTYFLNEPLTFTADDSGTQTAPVTFGGENHAVLSGGRPINGWHEIEINGKKGWAAELPDVKSGKWNFHQLFVNGQRRPRASLPKQGLYRFTGSSQIRPNGKYSEGCDEANFAPGQIHNWRNLGDVELVVLHFWVAPRIHIKSVDESANVVKLATKTRCRLTSAFDCKVFARYYVENVYEALTEPGEWYLDRSSGTLYYLPMPNETPLNTEVIAPRLPVLVDIAGDPASGRKVRNLTLANLSFEHAEWDDSHTNAAAGQASINVGGVIQMTQAQDCAIRGCSVSHVSNYAIEVGDGCENTLIEANTLTDLGAGGIKLGHGSNRATVSDNEIGDAGKAFRNAVGVWIGFSNNNLVAHNDIHHLFYSGVSVGWSWGYQPSKSAGNIIEYNHIHHIGQGLLSDMAGVYTLGVSPGTCVRNNFIHDVQADDYGGWGLYTDEGSTGIVMENNVVCRTTHGGYDHHYGKDNLIRNNILAFGRDAQINYSREEDHTSFTFERNIVYFTTGELLHGPWKKDHFEMDHNLYFRTDGRPFSFAGATLEAWRARGHDKDSIVADPLFVDPEKCDFRLKAGSPADKIGFVPIDIGSVGRLSRGKSE